MNKTTKIQDLIAQCKKVIAKYKDDDPTLWNVIETQVNAIQENTLKEQTTINNRKSIDFGPMIARAYDAKAEKDEMQPLYTLYFMAQMWL